MSGVQPVAFYSVQVPPGGIMVPSLPRGAVAMLRLTMAAIDPDAAPEYENDDDSQKPSRSTLKIVRMPEDLEDDEDDEDYSDDEEDYSEDDSDEEEINGGPSDKEKAKNRKKAAALKDLEAAMELDDSEDSNESSTDIQSVISQLLKGKAPATGDEDEEEDDEEGLELEEVVVCTLDTEKHYQQPLDLTFAEDERILFKVSGTHPVYLTGNYVMPAEDRHFDEEDEDEDEEDDDEYDLSPDEDELDGMDNLDFLLAGGEESDDLDDLEDPRVTELDSDEDEGKVPKLVSKGKNKRVADEEAGLDELIAKEAANTPATAGDKKQKKLKKNNGDAAPVEAKKDAKEAKTDKKVQFAKNLEQGPTPSTSQDKKASDKTTGTLGVKEVQGVKIDDKKLGKGPAAKNGNTVAMRYIGKLEDGKVFDSNKKGKPFTFKLGKGEVIKGWDIGIAGMAAGGERRITIPSHLAYGKKGVPGIPGNSKLIFDVKLLEIK